MKFSEIEYTRVDMEQVKQSIAELTERLKASACFEEADQAFLDMNALEGATLRTMRTVASIRRDIDTRDPFYDGEMAFYNRELPKLQPLKQQWTQTLLASPFRPELEQKYGSVSFLNSEMANKTFIPELVEDLQKESALVTEYTKLIASAQIQFRGNTYTLSQLSPYKLSPDDAERREAWNAEGAWYRSVGSELDRIYDELVALRDGMGKKMGYGGYTKLGYYRMNRNCYTEADVDQFRMAVQQYLVPVVKKMYMQQAKRMGFEFPLSFADKDLTFRSGNPQPEGTPAEILAKGTTFYSELSPETKEFWNHMMEHEMMDVESKPGKASGGYCTSIYALNTPFIFANFNGTAHDVEVITHEAGHAFAAYVNRNRVPGDVIWPSLEGCEVHSMSMEFFAEPWSELFFGKDAKKFLYTHLSGALSFIPYGTMVDHFQHIVYEYPEFGPEERHQVWQELLGVYMPWVRPDDIPFYGEGKGWQRQSHIYKRPFYYIDYCLAQTVALSFWAMIQEDRDKAWQTYMKYTSLGGTMVFTDLLKEAGLDSPFDPGCLKHISEKAAKSLESFDLSDLE
ncbi:MAG: M3 family oligoendopeptidase [Oscillospiraceae bacterium]|nr:M3 family oligoendopeptidase [Oscillospiraceae bacterium]MBR2889900.1 M3 family oligoendopeptidase [Oscillospiraceae bacterium]